MKAGLVSASERAEKAGMVVDSMRTIGIQRVVAEILLGGLYALIGIGQELAAIHDELAGQGDMKRTELGWEVPDRG